MKYISKVVIAVAFFAAPHLVFASPPVISTSSLPDTTVGSSYSQLIEASGGVGPYTWSIASGSLPPGLTLDDKVFSGAFLDATYSEQDSTNSWTDSGNVDGKRRLHFTSPSVAEDYGGVNQVISNLGVGNTYKVSFNINQNPDVNQGTSIGIRVLIDGNLVLSDSAPSGHYEVEFEATATSHTISVRVLNNTLGAGRVRDFDFYNLLLELVDLAPGNFASARVSGTPTTAGTYAFEVQVTDANLESDSANLSILVGPPPSITTISLPNTTVGAAYSQTLQATGGATPYYWSVVAGSLPDGLTINSSTGEISGTSTANGVFNFTAQVADDNSVTDGQALSITVNPAPTITTLALLALPGATVNDPYSLTLQATGGEAPLFWSVSSGSLPTGLSLSSSTGEISGTPTVVQTSSFTVQVTDAYSVSGTKAFHFRVNPMPAITTTSLAATSVGASYSQAVQASGGAAPYVWSILSGSLPPGLVLSNPTFPDNFLGSTYSEQDTTDSWTDLGTVSGKRRLHFLSCLSGPCFSVSGDYGELNQVFTGLQAGNTYKVSFDVNQNPDVNQGTIIATRVLVDGNLILEGPAPTGHYEAEFVATATSHTVSVRVVNNRLGNGRVRDFDFFNLQFKLTNLASGNLASAQISGNATTPGLYNFVARFADANDQIATKSLSILVHGTVTTTLTATGDTFIKQGAPNSNEGTNTFLRLQQSGRNRALVQFSPTAISNAVGAGTLSSATLQTTIQSNGNNWGVTGRTISAHSMTRAWTEAGATWNCANDTNTSNSAPNCTGDTWNMNTGDAFAGTASDTKNITNGQSGTVSFSITSDVQSFLSNTTSHNGWIIKKANETQAGSIEFDSREATNDPQLVLVVSY